MDKISVIVPVYNVENYLTKCLDSLIYQTYKNLEIIIIDDGSTDSSSAICDEYSNLDSRIKVVHQDNLGVASSIILGIKVSTGKYIGFVDSDDYINIEMFEKLYNNLIESSADVAMCNFARFGLIDSVEYNCESFVYVAGENIDNNARLLLEINNMKFAPCRWNKLFKRELFEEVLPKCNLGLVCGEDVNMTMLVFLKAKVVSYIDDILYYYLVRETSAVNTKKLYWDSYEKLIEILATEISNIKNLEIMILLKNFVVNIIKNRVNFALKNNLKKDEINKILSNKYFQSYIDEIFRLEKRLKTKIYDILLKYKCVTLIKIFAK